jgi:S1 RNA binding domain protein
MVISLDNGKVNLSMKRLEPKPQRDNNRDNGRPNFRSNNGAPHQNHESAAPAGNRTPRPAAAPATPPAPKTADQLFEERLKQFMTESDSKLSSLRQYADHRSKNRRR